MKASKGFLSHLRELAERPIGYSVIRPGSGLILRADWRNFEDIWINQKDASSEIGAPGSIIIFETEELADNAAREVGGMAVEVVVSSAGMA